MPGGSKYIRRWCKSKDAKKWKAEQYHTLGKKTCALCYKFMAWRQVSIDHIVPLGSGGEDESANAQLAHIKCNNLKGSTDWQPLGGLNER